MSDRKKAPPRRHHLSENYIKSLQPEEKDYIVWDDKQTGFGIKVTKLWTLSFVVQYRHEGRLRWFYADHYPSISVAQARKIAQEVRARAALGFDPHGEKAAARQGDTLSELANDYFAAKEKEGLKSADFYRAQYNRHLRPYLGARKASGLIKADFAKLRDRLSSGTAGQVITIAGNILGWAMECQRLPFTENPAHGIKIRHKAKERRAIEDDEIRQLWEKLPECGWPWDPILRIMLFTGQRPSEICNMRWSDINGEWWVQPTNKSDRVHTVYLAVAVRDVIAEQPRDAEFVFSSQDGKPFRFTNDVRSAIRKAIEIEDFVPYFLRHTVATKLSELGVPKEHRSKVLNHSEGGVTARYGHHDFNREKKAALLKLARHLEGVLGLAESGKVVALR
jgi:integrase